jgi:hypothetical protein
MNCQLDLRQDPFSDRLLETSTQSRLDAQILNHLGKMNDLCVITLPFRSTARLGCDLSALAVHSLLTSRICNGNRI